MDNDIGVQFKLHDHDGINSNRIKQTSWIEAYLPGTQAATATNYGIFFVATRKCLVQAISEVHSVAGTSVGSVTLQVERLQGTEALDSGDELLATAFDLKGTANTVQVGTLASGSPTLFSLNPGDRLALKDTGTLTLVGGLCVSVEIQFK